ncbi:MAG: hypothetical protein RIT32_230 [Actinomycetota bacterium]|jgi:glycerol uptake facilitator-like aquaporin
MPSEETGNTFHSKLTLGFKTIGPSNLHFITSQLFNGVIIRNLIAEFIGSLLLAGAVVGSGIMATNLSNDIGVQLFINAIATVFVLIALISVLVDISGAHFNPAVTLSLYLRKKISGVLAIFYAISQIIGMIIGVILANLMFELQAIEFSSRDRSGLNLFLAEVIATAGLILVIHLLIDQEKKSVIPTTVAVWIGSAYFFTSSTSFANPAITIARSLTDTFSGIAPSSISMFLLAQLVGVLFGLGIAKLLQNREAA